MPLSPAQFADFRRDGYILLPGAVAPELVDAAVHALNYRVGQGVPSDKLAQWQSQSFFPDLESQPVITDLFERSELRATMETLVGAGNVRVGSGGQLALRFPREPGAPVRPPRPHIDGVHTRWNGVPAGTLRSFTALVGVYLTDLPGEDAGNFTVWPGSHLRMQDYFREHGIKELLQGQVHPPLDFGPPLQIKAQAGDAVIAHYQLLHGAANNHAPRPRFTTFFRVEHPDHQTHRLECLTDLWREWPGVRAAVEA